ncbi:MAG: DUF488 domain-containing protein [Candidatus Eremiobacteraeota bacterium]|nr:DUF488 domain-containing protein [Candidatus Eremiobacteraeota bacterium]
MTLFTIGHGTVDQETLVRRLAAAGVMNVVDVRRFPGSRRWPWFGAAAMSEWLPASGIGYEPAPALGGRRTPRPASANVVLRERGFRGYADYMETAEFRDAFAALLARARERPTAIMCSETLWWRCHRRLIADAAVLLAGGAVLHIVGDTLAPHKPTAGVRLDGDHLVYDQGSG